MQASQLTSDLVHFEGVYGWRVKSIEIGVSSLIRYKPKVTHSNQEVFSLWATLFVYNVWQCILSCWLIHSFIVVTFTGNTGWICLYRVEVKRTENTLFFSCIHSKPSTGIVYFSFSLCYIGGASEWGAYWWCTIELAVLSFVSSEPRIFLQWIQFILFCCFRCNVIDFVVVIIIFMKCCRINFKGFNFY